jgi:hypothetical protein
VQRIDTPLTNVYAFLTFGLQLRNRSFGVGVRHQKINPSRAYLLIRRLSMRFIHVVVIANVCLGAFMFMQTALADEELVIVLRKSIKNSKCESTDCNNAVSTSGSGNSLSDGCTKTNGVCSGTCERCNGTNPGGTASTHCVNEKSTSTPCVVDPSSGGENFTCGEPYKYRCENSGGGPSSCCSTTQDGSQPQKGTGGCGASVCFP